MSNRFHLAIPAGDLNIAKKFYCELLGCEQGYEEINEQDSWVDINFWGNELTLHQTSSQKLEHVTHHVDMGDVRVPHFGVHLEWDDFQNLKQRLYDHHMDFVEQPYVRFKGGEQEQETMFIADPNDNVLEIKTMRNPDMLFPK